MVDTFKKGDMAIVIWSEDERDIGEEVEIKGPSDIYDDCLCVICSDGVGEFEPKYLRKKRPPEDTRKWFNENIKIDELVEV